MDFSVSNFLALLVKEYKIIGDASEAGRNEKKLAILIKILLIKYMHGHEMDFEEKEEMDTNWNDFGEQVAILMERNHLTLQIIFVFLKTL